MDLKKFFSELKRREVYKVAIVYGITAWLIAQISGLVSTSFDFPSWVMQMIITILIIGFPIALILSWVFEVSSKGIKKTAPLASVGSDEHKLMETRLVIGILVLIGLLMVGGWWTWQKFGFDKSPPIRNLVVLPFDNYTGSDEYDYFVAGMHSSLIQDIGKIGELTVKSKTTANSYKVTDLSVPEIAAELGIDAAVEGSITCMGEDSVCVQIRLIRAYPEEKQVWVQDYRVEKSQILNFYNKVTKTISKEINIVLTPQEENLLAETRTVDPKAYDAYLKGIYYYHQMTPEAFQKALEYFMLAIEKDPEWGPPYAGIAEFWIGMRQMGLAPSSVTIPKIYEYLDKATELDPNSANTHYVNALAAVWTGFNWEKGEKEFLKSLEINPNDAYSRMFYAHFLMIMKRKDEALTQGKLALELDPLNPGLQALYLVVLADAGDYEQAISLAEEVLAVVPNQPLAISTLYLICFIQKDYKKSLEYWTLYFPLEEDTRLTILKTFEEQGFHKAIEEYIIEVEKITGDSYPMDLAQLYTTIKEYSKAFIWLEKAYTDHDANLPYLSTFFVSFDTLFVSDPRYIDIVEKMNLALIDKQQAIENN